MKKKEILWYILFSVISIMGIIGTFILVYTDKDEHLKLFALSFCIPLIVLMLLKIITYVDNL